MARLGRDRFSSGLGLGCILRDTKVRSGTSRASVLLRFAPSPRRSSSKAHTAQYFSPASQQAGGPIPDTDELKEGELWAAEEGEGEGGGGCGGAARAGMGAMLGAAGDHEADDKVATCADWRTTAGRKAECRMIPGKERRRQAGGGEGEEERYRSAPVKVPDWKKMEEAARGGRRRRKEDSDNDNNNNNNNRNVCYGFGVEEEEEEEEEERLPPHQLLAKQNSFLTTSSMCHGGVGRTLKGRDLHSIRNAIWRSTGFID